MIKFIIFLNYLLYITKYHFFYSNKSFTNGITLINGTSYGWIENKLGILVNHQSHRFIFKWDKNSVALVSTNDIQKLVVDKIQSSKERERYITEFREGISKEII